MNSPPSARVLMCSPDYFGIEYEINPWMNVQDGSNAELARRQWQDLYQALAEMGAEIDLLAPVPGLPDLVFTANAAMIFMGTPEL